MAAAKDVLDRAGFTKTDKVEVSAANEPLFILPAKEDEEEQQQQIIQPNLWRYHRWRTMSGILL